MYEKDTKKDEENLKKSETIEAKPIVQSSISGYPQDALEM